MTVAGLPGIPGGSALVPALDAFVAGSLEWSAAQKTEFCGVFIYRHLEPVKGENGIEWIGEIEWIPLPNSAEKPEESFSLPMMDLTHIVQQELESLQRICTTLDGSVGTATELWMAAFSPFVGVGHSHPGGSVLPSAADYRLVDAAATWRRAAAPQTLANQPDDAQFFEANFIFAHDSKGGGHGTLVHFRRGLVQGTWEGNFSAKVD